MLCFLWFPQRVRFRSKFGPNFFPTFEVFLTLNQKKVTLIIQDQERAEVWKRNVRLPGLRRETVQSSLPAEDSLPADDRLPAEDRLLLVRTQFIKRVSEPVLEQLLDKLLERGVVNDDEMQAVRAKTRADKARDVIDTVRRKGTEASSVLISALCEVDQCLSRVLILR
uniref:CARD domain-containing protein n=1 Tax=Lates calcarifer TaxID=8187 RepID=A0A4W6D3Z8_LATCA